MIFGDTMAVGTLYLRCVSASQLSHCSPGAFRLNRHGIRVLQVVRVSVMRSVICAHQGSVLVYAAGISRFYPDNQFNLQVLTYQLSDNTW